MPDHLGTTLARTALAAALSSSLLLVACGPDPPPPAAKAPPAQTGQASYYGREFAGKPTASGEPFRPEELTAASRSLPLGTTAKVTNLETGKSVTVEVNDRGPYEKGRILDVSRKAAEHLEMKADGVATVQVQPKAVPPDAPSPSDDPPPP